MDMLFGHLASRFSSSPENLATEALAFILNRSAAMREAFRRLVGRTGIELPQIGRFSSQAGDEQGNIQVSRPTDKESAVSLRSVRMVVAIDADGALVPAH